MFYILSSQVKAYEHGVSADQRRAADIRAGEIAAALRDLRLCLGRAVRPKHRVRSGRRAAAAMTASAQVLPSAR